MRFNITDAETISNWIKAAGKNKMVVGSQARILYADAEGRMKIAEAFNNAIADNILGSCSFR